MEKVTVTASPMAGFTAFQRCQGQVIKAMNQAQRDHGNLTRDPVRATAILVEEVGEVCKEALNLTRSAATDLNKDLARRNLIIEVAQVAATAIWMLNNLITKGPGE